MTERIKKYICDLEAKHRIKVLWAVETGSRAWGFASRDSDYDIRLIYVNRNEWYLNLSEQKDSIELMLDNNDIDIAGWDLKKACNLLRKSNPALLERLQSPIVYRADDDFIEEFLQVSHSFYSKVATIHHYLSMAKKFLEQLKSNEEYKLKSFFYTLRSAMVCKWIVEKDEMPPIEFHEIYKNLNIESTLVDRIEKLIAIKSTIEESYFHKGESELVSLIEDCILQAEENKNMLTSANGNLELLNLLFKKYVAKYDN